jgi:hypothetical protein
MWLMACEKEVHLSNVGGLCILGKDSEDDEGNPVQKYDSAIELKVEVRLDQIGGCVAAIEATCSAKVSGQEIAIRANGSYLDTSRKNEACPAQEFYVDAQCTIPKLHPGTYTLKYGDEKPASLVIPSEGPPIVIGKRAPCAE